MADDKVLAVWVAIDDCFLVEEWEANSASPDPQDFWAYQSYYRMWRAALLFSLLALRKVADFAQNHGSQEDDINLSDFQMELEDITGCSEILDRPLRKRINKGIAHLTEKLDPDADELRDLREELKKRSPMLHSLRKKFFSMI